MKSRILVIMTLAFLAAFVACKQEPASGTSATTVSLSTEGAATTDATEPMATDSSVTDMAAPTPDGAEQIAEGAKMLGAGLKEEARQAVAAGGAAMQQAGETLQDKAEAAAPQNTTPAPQGNVANGTSIFKAKCASCHGADASGNTAIGKKNNLVDLRSSAVQSMTDPELAELIANGKAGGMSVAAHKSKGLTQDQIKDVIAYMRSIRL